MIRTSPSESHYPTGKQTTKDSNEKQSVMRVVGDFRFSYRAVGEKREISFDG